MAYRSFRAHLQDKQTIRITIKEEFFDHRLKFNLALKNDLLAQELRLPIINYFQDGNYYIFELQTVQALDFDEQYMVYDNDRNVTQLEWGAIVRTSVFDNYFYYDGDDLGSRYSPEKTQFKLWAPISEKVFVVVEETPRQMRRQAKGVWKADVEGDLDGKAYYYLHLVNGKWRETQDPYALSAQANSGHSYVINPEKIKLRSSYTNPIPINQSIIYELSVRDFSSQNTIPFKHRKQYLGLTESPQVGGHRLGLDYVKNLGVTHVQLMPIYDFGSIDENNIDLVYNWGYDPMLYNVPEGGYASDPNDPYARIIELQKAIETYHDNGIGVIMDVVYNHVYDVDQFVLEKIVPGYCSRYDANNRRFNSTGCGNDMGTERLMVRKFIIDSILIWMNYYGMDGFRFDLMGVLDIDTMLAIEEQARAIYPNIYLYGEGWQMMSGLDASQLAHQFNSYQTPGIGFFNDRFREEIKELICRPDVIYGGQKNQVIEEVLTASIGMVELSGRYYQPSQSLNYVECHDNATYFDYLTIHNPSLSHDEKRHRASFAQQIILLSQGVAFLHSGQEAFRTKGRIDNTYNQPDRINRFDWKRTITYRDHVSFIGKLIAFRKAHPILSLETDQEMENSLDFFWLTPTALKYSLQNDTDDLLIIFNFGQDDYSFDVPKGYDLYLHNMDISLDTPLEISPNTVEIKGLSLIILKK
ncbi:type I pullulanase [Streptococcus moroccensis]|uniref:Pullulanase n=1 Tax=Streptococcus moroccensis TaxID=1451356 RepID=A0ABT9YR23_9STRE|nr:type I pullulanase [Streptococcus moroccensis]MDQ0221748.1 pullulanase [Streptococcus moroccensis]